MPSEGLKGYRRVVCRTEEKQKIQESERGAGLGTKGEDWLQEQEGELSGRGPGMLERRPGRGWNWVPKGGPRKSAKLQGSWARVTADRVGD